MCLLTFCSAKCGKINTANVDASYRRIHLELYIIPSAAKYKYVRCASIVDYDDGILVSTELQYCTRS